MPYERVCTKSITEESLDKFPDLHKFLKSDPPDVGLLGNIDINFHYSITYQEWGSQQHPLELSLIQILSAHGYKKHIEALKLPPDQIKYALQADEYSAVRWTVENYHRETFEFLIDHLDRSEIKSFIQQKPREGIFQENIIYYVCSTNQFDILQVIKKKLTTDDLKEVFQDDKSRAIKLAMELQNTDIIKELQQVLDPDVIKDVFTCNEYEVMKCVIKYAGLKMIEILEKYLDHSERKKLLLYYSAIDCLVRGLKGATENHLFNVLELEKYLKLLEHFDNDNFLPHENQKIKEEIKNGTAAVIDAAFWCAHIKLRDKPKKIDETRYKNLLVYKELLEHLIKRHSNTITEVMKQLANEEIKRFEREGFSIDKVASPAQVGVFCPPKPQKHTNNGDGQRPFSARMDV